ncbi:MAG: hypothetical protein D3914_04160 [Candidatus Electrothrix sp. LOE2]|nr:hypothetical protein [Candidatus Electrothrix sp. LOE2]
MLSPATSNDTHHFVQILVTHACAGGQAKAVVENFFCNLPADSLHTVGMQGGLGEGVNSS